MYSSTNSRAKALQAFWKSKKTEENIAKAIEDIGRQNIGAISIKGEVWKAISDEEISKGEEVKIIGIDGVKLKVEKF